MEEIIYYLREPVTLGKTTIIELTLKEPTAGQLRRSQAGENGTAMDIIMISEMTNVPVPVIEAMKISDYREVSKILRDFMTGDPETGTVSSPT